MSKGRLTRQELGWLLTQEAAGAAERLRTGVQILKSNPPPEEGGAAGVDATLDALDDTMRMLSSLHNRPVRLTGRRGRIDLAALLWEVAPDARAAIEPGSGTEVFGDEAELRRMLQLLVEHGSGAGSQVTIRRDGDMVEVAVVLGPDATATAEAERAWLSRMATRYGGRLDLEGGMEIFSLPADSERVEREALERELDEARKQGEAYARELAAAFTTTEEGVSPSTFPPPLAGTDVGDRVAVLVRVAGGVAAELRSLLMPAVREIAALADGRGPQGGGSDAPRRSGDDDRFETIRRELAQVQDLAHGLASVGDVDVQELPGPVSVGEVVGRQVAHAEGRAGRAGVTVNVTDHTQGKAHARTSPRAITALVDSLLNQAIKASPPDTTVDVAVTDEERGPCVRVDDSGPPLPATARKQFVGLETEPGTYGRPTSLPLYVAAALASWQGATFELADAPSGGLRVRVTFSR
jgi:two-component system OmpR family sensor kinase